MNLLRTAAATNQVQLRVKHFHPPLSSVEYQKLLYEEKSTDDDDEHHRQNNQTTNNKDEVQIRKSSRRQHRSKPLDSSHELSIDQNQSSIKGLDASSDALQALLNSRFQLIDLIDLLKKAHPKYFSNDQNRELQFHQQLSETNSGKNFIVKFIFHSLSIDGRITLKDFERQSSVLLGERINLLTPFYSSSLLSTKDSNDPEHVLELRREISSSQAKIDELQTKIVTCEKSQRLANEVELEYEDLLKYLHEQLKQSKVTEMNHFKQIRAKDQLIQKLFTYLSRYVNQPNDEHFLAQLKYEYEQQQRSFSNSNYRNSMGS